MSQKFIKCFSQSDSNELKNKGFNFLYEENGVHWFILDETINFSDCGVDYKIVSTINL